MKTKSIARFSLLCAMALVLGYFERFIPVAPGIPGVKLGLANTVLLYAVYLMGAKSAMLLMLAKVVLSGFLFAGLSGMLYSLAGGLLSLCVMLLLSRRVPQYRPDSRGLHGGGITGGAGLPAGAHDIRRNHRYAYGNCSKIRNSRAAKGGTGKVKRKNYPAGIIPAG